MPTHQHFQVGPVQLATAGYAVNITDLDDRPLFSIVYRTMSEAEVARDAVEQTLENAVAVENHG